MSPLGDDERNHLQAEWGCFFRKAQGHMSTGMCLKKKGRRGSTTRSANTKTHATEMTNAETPDPKQEGTDALQTISRRWGRHWRWGPGVNAEREDSQGGEGDDVGCFGCQVQFQGHGDKNSQHFTRHSIVILRPNEGIDRDLLCTRLYRAVQLGN
jgi:hypothetical protein